MKWAFVTGSFVDCPAIGADGTIYVGSWDYNLYAIKPRRHAEVGVRQLAGVVALLRRQSGAGTAQFTSAPVRGGFVLYGDDQPLYAIWHSDRDPSDGRRRRRGAGDAQEIAPTSLKFPKTKLGTPEQS